jgi:hypothetical protein
MSIGLVVGKKNVVSLASKVAIKTSKEKLTRINPINRYVGN